MAPWSSCEDCSWRKIRHNVMYARSIAEVGSPWRSCEDSSWRNLINCGLRSFGLTFRTSRFARQVPQLAALALHTAGFTAQASQFAQSLSGLHYFTCNTIFIWLELYNFKALLNCNIILFWLLYNLWASIIKLAYNIITITYYVKNLAQG